MSAPSDTPHVALVAAFRRGLSSGAPPPGMTARDPAETARRFAVYRNNVAHSLTQALRQRFPVCERQVGPAFFGAMAGVFVGRHPPDDPVLARYGAAFPAFLSGFPPVAGLPFLPDVARLELLRGAAYHAADADPVAPARFLDAAGSDPEALRLRLHPSVRWLASDWPVFSIWTANQPGGDGAVRHGAAEAVLIGRDPAGRVVECPLPHGLVPVLARLHAGQALGVAAGVGGPDASPAPDPAPLLAALLRHGLIIDARTDKDPSP